MNLPPYLTPNHLDALIRAALEEDIGTGDITSIATVPDNRDATASLILREAGVVAGTDVFTRVLHVYDKNCTIEWHLEDGERVPEPRTVAHISGNARSLLATERTALNLLQRMSGIATATDRMVRAVAGTGATILDTRKTVLRTLDKWAVLLGGGENHRVGLHDMVLIKENHIAAAGGIGEALEAVKCWASESDGMDIPVEIEIRTLEELYQALDVGGFDRVLLDNMVRPAEGAELDVSILRSAVEMIDGHCASEASGNITLETVRKVAETGVDYISCGALTHSVRALDLSLLIHV